MKKPFQIILTILFLLPASLLCAQEEENQNCKVLLESIAELYEGECKKGLAHGDGKARGEATYEGRFKKGLPHGLGKMIYPDSSVYDGRWKKGKKHGQGQYTYYENNKKKVRYGYWRKDEYLETAASNQGYQVLRQKAIKRVSIRKVGTLPDVDINYTRGGTQGYVAVKYFEASSGYGYSEIKFPYKAYIKFEVPNVLNTSRYTCELEFVITEPGSWVVEVSY
jgi:hypothetical protein